MISEAMPVNDEKNLYISWQEYEMLSAQLAQQVYQSGWQFDYVLCLARGGLIVGNQVSRIFDVPMAILSTRSYQAPGVGTQAALNIAQSITLATGQLSGNILLVDDLVDSGVTLQQVQQHLHTSYPEIKNIRSAVLWFKACSKIRPDYFATFLENNPWIHQPFEIWDHVRPKNLSHWLKKFK